VAVEQYEEAVERGAIGEALRTACELAVFGNEYFQRKRPWETRDPCVVASGAALVRAMAVELAPYVPRFAGAVLRVFGISEPRWDDLLEPLGGRRLTLDRVLLERIDATKIQRQVEAKAGGTAVTTEKAEAKGKPIITFSDFEKLDLRVGEILSASEMPDADKLWHLSVRFGDKTRSCVAGIKQAYRSDELVGKRVIALVNLEPRTIRGVPSECMLLAAHGEGMSLAIVDRAVEPGSPVS